MIILKILLYVLLAVFGLILLILIVPVGAEFSFIDGKLEFSVKAWFITVLNSEGGGVLGWIKKWRNKPKKPEKPKKIKEKKDKKDKSKKRKSVVNDDDFLADFDFDAPESENFGNTDTSYETEYEPSMTDSDMDEIEWDNEPKPEKKKLFGRKKKTDNDTFEDEVQEDDEETKEKRSLGDWAELGIGIWESAQRPLLKIFKGFHFQDLYIDFVIADLDAYKCALNYGRISGGIYNTLGVMSTLFTVKLKTVDVNAGFGLSKGRWDCSCRMFFRAGIAVIAGIWFLITYLFRTFLPDKIRNFKKKKSAERQKRGNIS